MRMTPCARGLIPLRVRHRRILFGGWEVNLELIVGVQLLSLRPSPCVCA
jgi:hypothetical protein